MEDQKFDINKLRVASPCSVGWETMTGDERVRHCHSCKLNIYNIAEMTKPEVEKLIGNREGRLCIRLYKRADGTVLTKNCPVGFRAYQKRIARFASATLAAILGLFSISFGQTRENENQTGGSKMKITRTETQTDQGVLYGIITDPQGAIVTNVKIKLFKKGKKKAQEIFSDDSGKYSFNLLEKGVYKLEIKFPGYDRVGIQNIKITPQEKNELNITLLPKGDYVVVGTYGEPENAVDVTLSSVKTTITQRQIESLPF